MINYIFELMAFIVSIACYLKGDTKSMAIWLAATCTLGICATIGELYEKRHKKEVK